MSWDQPLSTSETKAIVCKEVDSAVSSMSYHVDKKLMELASSQANAMQELGEHIQGSLYRIDEAANKRFLALTDGIMNFARALDAHFDETNERITHVLQGIDDISDQLDDITDRLDGIEFNPTFSK